jgi:hypothetical protein
VGGEWTGWPLVIWFRGVEHLLVGRGDSWRELRGRHGIFICQPSQVPPVPGRSRTDAFGKEEGGWSFGQST